MQSSGGDSCIVLTNFSGSINGADLIVSYRQRTLFFSAMKQHMCNKWHCSFRILNPNVPFKFPTLLNAAVAGSDLVAHKTRSPID
jgi:hypothetical protein